MKKDLEVPPPAGLASTEPTLAERVAEFESNNPPPTNPFPPEPETAPVPREINRDVVAVAYAAYITQLAIRSRPKCALTFDELTKEEQDAWTVALQAVL